MNIPASRSPGRGVGLSVEQQLDRLGAGTSPVAKCRERGTPASSAAAAHSSA
jgi:hypothetical protein